MIRIGRIACALFAVVLVASLVGCGAVADKAAEELTEAAVEAGTGADVEIDDDGVTIETDDGEISIETEGGSLPADFPEDFPVRMDDDIDSTTTMAMGDSTNHYVGLISKDDFDVVYDWYRTEPLGEGWESVATVSTDSDGLSTGMLSFAKGDDQASIALQEETDGTVTIAITLVTKD